MINVKFTVKQQTLQRIGNYRLIQDSKNYVQLDFAFYDESWNSATKTVIFKTADGKVYSVEMGSENSVVVPEICCAEASFTVALVGYDVQNDVRITTNAVEMGLGESGYAEGETPPDPYPEAKNMTISRFSHVEGTQNIVGSMAFNIVQMLGHENKYKLDSVEGLEVGDVYSVVIGGNYENVGSITAIDAESKIVTVDKFAAGSASGDSEMIFRIMAKPLVGTTVIGEAAHAEGINTYAEMIASHAEGMNTIAGGKYSHAEGIETASGYAAHAEGWGTQAIGHMAHSEGYKTKALGNNSHAEGEETQAKGVNSHAEGYKAIASEQYSHAEGRETNASGQGAHAEGYQTVASGEYSHAEGNSKATSHMSHAEGQSTTASGARAHSEGSHTVASGDQSHAEGLSTKATGLDSHAEGWACEASGGNSHAGGAQSVAGHNESFVHGNSLKTSAATQAVFGKFNADSSNALFIIGNGTSTSNRSNALEVLKDGSLVVGGVKITPAQLQKLLALLG